VIPPSAPLPESCVAARIQGRICRVVGSARVGRDHVDSSRCVQGVGRENPAFLHNNGAGVAGFASHGVAAYSWWGSFMHSFVVPNASWIAVVVAFSELAIVSDSPSVSSPVSPRSPAWRCSSRTSCRYGQCLRLLRTVRDHRARHVAHVDVDWRRRNHRWIQAASSPRRTGRSSGRCDTSSGTRFGRLVKSESLSPRRSHMERRGLFALTTNVRRRS